MTRVHILLPVHNRKATTAAFIDCLRAQTHQDYRLVLVDDGSTDGTSKMVQERLPGSVILRGDGELWWAGALQLGYCWLKSDQPDAQDLVLLINDDTRIAPDFLATAISLLDGKSGVMLHAQCREESSGQLLDDGVRVNWRRLRFSPVHDSTQVDCLSTRGLFIRVDDFLDSGGFRPASLPHYLSDYEFTFRLRRRGVKPMLDPRLKLWTDWRVSATPSVGWSAARRVLFSRRNPSDPRAWMVFVLLSCPWLWKPWCLLLVGKRSIARLFRLALGGHELGRRKSEG